MAALKALRTLRDKRLGRLPLYEDITPSSRWTDGTDGGSLIIDLSGFKKEEVNLEIDGSGNATIRGRHDVGRNRFQRFSMTVKAPEDTEMKGIVGNFEDGLYTVVFPKMAAAEAEETELGQKQLGQEAASEENEPEAAENKTETVSAAKEKTLKTEIPEAEKATKTLESPAVMPQSCTKTEDSGTQEPETSTKAAVTASCVLESSTGSAKGSENAATMIDSAPALPETNSSPEMTKADEAPAPKPKEEGKPVIKDELHEHQGIKKEGGFLENVMEKINEHKACIISAILAFSMGILLSRKISS